MPENLKKDLFALKSYGFDLPSELIAQHPTKERELSRLLLVDRKSGNLSEMPFYELTDFLQEYDQLVLNNTKVIPARLLGKRSQGGSAEIFLSKQIAEDTWEVLARPGKKLKVNATVWFGDDFRCQVIEELPSGGKVVQFFFEGSFDDCLNRYGQIPLPHYIERNDINHPDDLQRYQTVYASEAGAVAAPTAGLHFSEKMFERLAQKNVSRETITLHVGLGTFKPVQTDDIRNHPMHQETALISQATADTLNHRKEGKRQICVGTTTCRALESAANEKGIIIPGRYETSIFIYPGYTFKYVQALLTNFHLPESTLLMLVSAFAGYELIREAYQKAIKERFRFFSYGDAMLII